MFMQFSLARRIAASKIQINKDTDKSSIENMLSYPQIPLFSNGELLEHQIEHSKRLLYVLKNRNSAGDTSPPGLGKTHVGAYLARELNLPVMVFCPKSAISMWWKVLSLWGVPVVSITNYDMARSSHTEDTAKWYDMRGGYTEVASVCPWITKTKSLTKSTSANREEKEEVHYKWSLPYKCFIIFDEEHVGKNIHTQTFSFIKGAIESSQNQGHKMLFLSATPIEKITNVKSIFFFLGLITKPSTNSVKQYYKEKIGADEKDIAIIHKYMYDIDISGKRKSTGVLSSMPSATIPKGIINDIRPVCYQMTEETTRKIAEKSKEIIELRKKLKERLYDSTLGAINANRRFIETYKIEKIEELALAALNGTFTLDSGDIKIQNKQFKRVAIFVNYKSTLHELRARLSSKKVPINGKEQYLDNTIALIYGDQTKKSETDEEARRYNSGEARILISTIRKGGLSLSFHDTVGDKETLVIICPPTSATDLLQVQGRSFRTNVKSSVTQVILFTLGDKIEESIRDALAKKLNEIMNFTTGANCSFDLYDLADEQQE